MTGESRHVAVFDRLDRELSLLLSDRSRFRRVPPPWLRMLTERLRVAALDGQRLHFILEWGLGINAKWGRADSDALRHAMNTADSVAQLVGCEGDLILVVTDTHAAINGLAESQWRNYADALISNSAQHHVATEMLSSVVGGALYDGDYDILDRLIDADVTWSSLTPFQREELERRATMRSLSAEPQSVAKRYAQASIVEGATIRAKWPSAIGLTYHTTNFGFLVPPLPTVFMFVEPGRVIARPWFRHYVENCGA